jgi:hypothetical protein
MPCPEELVALEAFWHLKRGQRLLPSRADFTPEDLRPWLGNIALVAVEREPSLRFRITLSGTRLDDYRGWSVTGQYIDTVSEAIAGTLPHYMTALESRQPVHFVHDNSSNSAIYRNMAKLLLPLSDDGLAVDRFMAAIYPLRANDTALPPADYALAG